MDGWISLKNVYDQGLECKTRNVMIFRGRNFRNDSGKGEMENAHDNQCERSAQQNIMPQEIPKLFRDALIILHDSGEFSVEGVNRKLLNLGWNEDALDEGNYKLIVSLYRGMRNS
jgi:hypothetical protein